MCDLPGSKMCSYWLPSNSITHYTSPVAGMLPTKLTPIQAFWYALPSAWSNVCTLVNSQPKCHFLGKLPISLDQVMSSDCSLYLDFFILAMDVVALILHVISPLSFVSFIRQLPWLRIVWVFFLNYWTPSAVKDCEVSHKINFFKVHLDFCIYKSMPSIRLLENAVKLLPLLSHAGLFNDSSIKEVLVNGIINMR